MVVRALHTPGHTPACVTCVIEDSAFVGDTLFMPDYGTARADFPGGDARTLYKSIQKILSLPLETRIFVGHDYLPKSRIEIAWESTVAEQLASNIHLRGYDEETFVAMREARDETPRIGMLGRPGSPKANALRIARSETLKQESTCQESILSDIFALA